MDSKQVLDPIFVFDHAGDAYIEAKDRPLSMEAIDVSAGEYEVAYDLSGQRFVLAVAGHPETGTVVLRPTGEYDVEDLERRLRSYLATAGLEVPQTGDLPIAAANAISAAEWERRWPKWPRWLASRLFGERPQRYGRSA